MSSPYDYEQLFREEGPRLWRTMYAVSGGRSEIAEEAVAEAFARALARRNGIAHPLAWIYRTAFRLAREELRRERRLTERQNEVSEPSSGIPSPDQTPELISALRTLSPNQRAVVVLRFEEDLPVSEIARLMGISPATVRVHLHRGRTRLRKLLGSAETSDE